MGLFTGKKGLVMGVANDHSIASGVAKVLHAEGATIGYSHLPDEEGRGRMEARVRKAVDGLNPAFVLPCDVSDDESTANFFRMVQQQFGNIDFFVHSIAFAAVEDLRGSTLNASRKGFLNAMNISAYSFIATAKHAAEIMPNGGAMLAMTYLGGERVVPGYNMMGVCKAALESCIKYVAFDLGAKNIRVNGLSAGPVRTLAAAGIGDFKTMLSINSAIAPMQKNITLEDVGRTTAFLLSDWAQSITGENVHVDAGYHVMAGPSHALEKLATLVPR
ncbi:MAG: enoyl-ACP reductase [Proteobacteria bacterium]|nr:enoyl-ACP reductase [Pseudomonadota bacterium]